MGNDPSDKTTDTPGSETARSGQSHEMKSGPLTHLLTAPSTRPNVRHIPGFTETRYGSPSPLSMGTMSYALPGHHSQYGPMQYPAGQNVMYPMPLPYGPNAGVPYNVSYPYPPYLMQQPPHGHHYQSYANQPLHNIPQSSPYPQNYYSYANRAGHRDQMHTGSAVGRAQTNADPSSKLDLCKESEKQMTQLEYDVSKTIVDGSNPMKVVPPYRLPPDTSASHSAPPSPSTPRGPPRKPKQSGHALWVGNLPPGANVIDLKDHFSQDATHDIESVFLISKSNCAFVNYKSAAACAAALTRFHDSRFQGVRVVCRLRRGFTAPGSGATVGNNTPRREDLATVTVDVAPVLGEDASELSSTQSTMGAANPPTRVVDRYFIVKSLTTEDLELSKLSGIWATQYHNEAVMNQAYEAADYVYLIFSANKSGEYFGYARMMSPINNGEDLTLEIPSRPDPLAPDDCDVTLTTATTNAPQGRIIDDPTRGTIFWEVDSNEDDSHSVKSVEPEEPDEQTPRKPFRIEWISTNRVPFHRTRGLRNPWNANREIKIARDGTEIEPAIGRKLIQLFHA